MSDTPTEDEERTAFEDWCRWDHLPTHKDAAGQYKNSHTWAAWRAWDARSAHSGENIKAVTAYRARQRLRWPNILGL